MDDRDKKWARRMAVYRVAWGYLFLHLHINVFQLDLLPDWMCYVWILKAIPIFQDTEPSLTLLRPMGIALGVYSALIWAAGVFGITIESYLLEVIVAMISVYFHFQFFTNLAAVAHAYGCPEEKRLLRLRTVRTVAVTLWVLPLPWKQVGVLVGILVVTQLVVAFWICRVLFSLSKSLWGEETGKSEIPTDPAGDTDPAENKS